jgi:hypothetical protein
MNALATLGLAHLKGVFVPSDITMENNEEIISRLKFIGHIQKDEKINVRLVHRQPNNFATKIYRTVLYPDNRFNALKFIRDVISRSFDIIEHYLHRSNILVCKSIISDLVKARQGIINLKYTYSDDTKFCCDMDVLIENINSQLSQLEKEHPEIFQEDKKQD